MSKEFIFDEHQCGIKIKDIHSDNAIEQIKEFLGEKAWPVNIRSIKSCISNLQAQTKPGLFWSIDNNQLILKASIYDLAKKDFEDAFKSQIERLESAKKLFPFVQEVSKSWNKKCGFDPYLFYSGRCTLSFNWANGCVAGVLINLHLGADDQIKDAVLHFHQIRQKFPFKFKASDPTEIFDGSCMEYDWLWENGDKVKTRVTMRIWVSESKVCQRVEDGTQPKYKIICA